MQVETQAQADQLNRTGEYGPYRAANGHTMIAPLRFPREPAGDPIGFGAPHLASTEREYRVGDTIRYDSFAAWCAKSCDHSESGPPEDW